MVSLNNKKLRNRFPRFQPERKAVRSVKSTSSTAGWLPTPWNILAPGRGMDACACTHYEHTQTQTVQACDVEN